MTSASGDRSTRMHSEAAARRVCEEYHVEKAQPVAQAGILKPQVYIAPQADTKSFPGGKGGRRLQITTDDVKHLFLH